MDLLPIVGRDLSDYDALLQDFYEERIAHIQTHGFQDGEGLNEAILHVQCTKEEQVKLNFQNEALRDYEHQLSMLERDLAEFDTAATRKLLQLDERLASERDKLLADQTRELERNDSIWQSAAKARQYNRASVQLVVQRRQLASLLQQCRFAEAEQVQRIIKRTDATERENIGKLMQHDYNDAVAKLMAKHENELDFFNTTGAAQRAQLMQQIEAERIALVKRRKKIEKRGEDASNKDKVWALAHVRHAAAISREVVMSRGSAKKTVMVAPPPIQAEVPEQTIILPRLQLGKHARKAQTAR
jgi:hypothetical protein